MVALNYENLILSLPLWKNPKISKLQGGMTNINYLVEAGKKKYVARFALSSNKHLSLDREREIYNTKIAASEGIGPLVIAHYPEYNLLIVEYLPGKTLSLNSARKKENIDSIAKLLKKLHNGRKFKGENNIFSSIRFDIGKVKERNSWLPEDLQLLLKRLKLIESKVKFQINAPCHLDLMMENIVTYKQSLKLLDWEYSANSDYLYDLAMLSVKAAFDKEQDHFLLECYGKPKMYEQLKAMKKVVYFKEASWGLLQLAVSSIPIDYKRYAEENLQEFRLSSVKA